MPTYLFRCLKCDHVFERVLPIADREDGQICECGHPAKRDIVSEQRTVRDIKDRLWAKHVSTGLGVHPDQVPEERERLRTVTGNTYDFTPDGDLMPGTRRRMRAALKATGYHNRDGGYGDG